MSSKNSGYVIELDEQLVDGLAKIAIEMGVNNIQDIAHAIIKEKIYDVLGIDLFTSFDSQGVRLTPEDDLVEQLRKESLVYSNLGPSVMEANDQKLTPEECESISGVNEFVKDETNRRMDRLEELILHLTDKVSNNPSFQGR